MPAWVVALLICLGFYTLLIAANLCIAFHATMAGGGSPWRWYRLLFGVHGMLGRIAVRSRRSLFIFMLLIFGSGILIHIAIKPYDGATWGISFVAWLVFLIGFPVALQPR